jgi:hypothetical protein
LNIRPSGDNWKGMRTEQTDSGFLQFITPFYGLRAGAMTLLTYYRIHKRRTVSDIISSWAPPSDNNPTSDYIDTVCRALGVGSRDLLDLETPDNLRRLMEAMIKVEAGSQPFAKAELEAAITSAYNSHRARPVSPGIDTPVPAQPSPVTVVPVPAPKPSAPAPHTPWPSAPPAMPRHEPDTSPTPPLVDQTSAAPTRKVNSIPVGGLFAGIPTAFVVQALWNKMMPESPMEPEVAIALAGMISTAFAYGFAYFTRNRASDIPPSPASASPRIEP